MDSTEYLKESESSGEPACWNYLPAELLVEVFKYLPHRDLGCCCQVCTHWSGVGNIDYLWKRRFQLDFSVAGNAERSSESVSWKTEYERAIDSVPSVMWEQISEHNDEVLHVSFANNGMMFCTCSKDATAKVFNANWPFETLHSLDLGRKSLFCWEYTQYSQFNQSDSELLVSGRCFGSDLGEINIYYIFPDTLSLLARIRINPYDVMGVWLNESHIISSRHHGLRDHGRSFSEIVLNRSNQEIDNLRQSTVNRLFLFANANAYINVIYLKVADMSRVISQIYESNKSGCSTSNFHSIHSHVLGNCSNETADELHMEECATTSKAQITCNKECNTASDLPTSESCVPTDNACSTRSNLNNNHCIATDCAAKPPEVYKVLLAFIGQFVDAVHQIGVKLISQQNCDDVHVSKIFEQGENSKTRPDEENVPNSVTADSWDHIIDVGGQLIGMEVSECGRYLYASYRAFLDESRTEYAASISSIVTISLYDLISMEELKVFYGSLAVSHTFFLFLTCAGEYVASGSEDGRGYIWDKHYGCVLSTLRHNDVVNCVALNPCDSSMAVSVSDDCTVKIWRSKGFMRMVNAARPRARSRHSSISQMK